MISRNNLFLHCLQDRAILYSDLINDNKNKP